MRTIIFSNKNLPTRYYIRFENELLLNIRNYFNINRLYIKIIRNVSQSEYCVKKINKLNKSLSFGIKQKDRNGISTIIKGSEP